jgi:DNA polymerase-3 subunit delta'
LIACEKCPACGLVEAGTHPDFITVGRPEEKNEFPVELMRELCRTFALKSARGRGKIAVLNDADDLNEEAANCFLKTLEEPPPQSLFLLLGTSRDRQLPTILSRCQLVRFAPLPDTVMTEVLAAHGVTDAAMLPRVLHLAAGSPGQALALADPELWKFRKEFLNELCRKPLNPVTASKKWLEYVETAGKEMPLQRRQAGKVLQLLLAFLRDALALRLGARVTAEPEELHRLQIFAEQRSPERLLELIDRCLEAEAQIRRYVQLSLVLEGLVDAFCE